MNIFDDGQHKHKIEVRKEKNNRFSVTIDGFPHLVEGRLRADGQLEFKYNNKVYRCVVSEEDDKTYVFMDGHSYKLVRLEAGSTFTDEQGLAAEKVTAPMPGVIVKILVNEGDHVKVNQKVVILEAMKMQNTLVAPYAGTVSQVLVKEGDQVDEGMELIKIEQEEIESE